MRDTRVTVASLRSIIRDPKKNLALVRKACVKAHKDGARLLVLPELMLTGHGGHRQMMSNAEPVPEGSLSRAVLKLSDQYDLCICVGIAELKDNIVYNSQMVVDKGKYLGLQRKINMSGDEYCYFGAGEKVEAFDIEDLRFGVSICYDNAFPELALIHSLNNVDLMVAPHAARTGEWPKRLTAKFCAEKIKRMQKNWEKVHRARAYDNNVYVLICNAVGPSTEGLKNVVANHAGTVMGVSPDGEVFLRTSVSRFVDEIVTVQLGKDKRAVNHAPSRNRRLRTIVSLLQSKLNP